MGIPKQKYPKFTSPQGKESQVHRNMRRDGKKEQSLFEELKLFF
jgi:hypothetical protein